MQVKRNLVRREATQDEIANLKYPKEKFELISVDYTDTWTYPVVSNGKTYQIANKSVMITLKCKKCGHTKQVVDKLAIGCKQGPCHPKWIDRTGVRYGRLLAVRPVRVKRGNSHTARWSWECKCDCGATCYIHPHSFEWGKVEQCQICARKQAVSKTTLPGKLSSWHRVYKDTRNNALKRSYEFSLSFDHFKKLAESDCYYCGVPPILGSYGIKRNGIDRLDNTNGYTKDNSVPCCAICNRMKMAQTETDFYSKILQIVHHRKLRFNDHPEMEYTSSEVEMGDTQNG